MPYQFTPPGSTPSLTKSLDGTPVGTLADFTITQSNTPLDPRDSSGQIPTMTATLTDTGVSARALIDEDVTLNDWTGTETSARVVSVQKNANSGLTSIDTSTVFQRLNTEQTTFPVIGGESFSPAYTALTQWALMCGIPEFRTPGNLLQCIPNGNPGTVGLIADSISAFRDSDTVGGGTYRTFSPTASYDTAPLEVNPSQGIIFGAFFFAGWTLSEVVINAKDRTTNQLITYKIRRNGDTYSVREKVGAAAETVLLSGVKADATNYYQMVNVKITANATAGKVDVAMRIIEAGQYNNLGPSEDIVTDFTATAVTSSIRNRPRPWRIDLGYDGSLTAGHTVMGPPAQYFLSEGTVLPQTFPVHQVDYQGPIQYSGEDPFACWPEKIPGFTGNVWERMKEFCSILELDIFFTSDGILFQHRNHTVKDDLGNIVQAVNVSKGNLSESVTNREVAKAVEVIYREWNDAITDYTNNEMWRADHVYTINQGETLVEVVQTNSTFTQLHAPVPVNGVPVPYNSPYGSYVITGNDGYIVDPAWWTDNGGYVKVNHTGIAGEIEITMKAPNIDTVRAPYRVSEGVADRPALYIFGNGLNMGEDKTLRVLTGAADAAQEVGVKFDTPFITSLGMAYSAGNKLAEVFGTATSSISFDVSKASLEKTSSLYGTQYDNLPQGARVFFEGAHYRVADYTMTPRAIQVSKAVPYTTVTAVADSLGASATVADWNNLHGSETTKQAALAPLSNYIS